MLSKTMLGFEAGPEESRETYGKKGQVVKYVCKKRAKSCPAGRPTRVQKCEAFQAGRPPGGKGKETEKKKRLCTTRGISACFMAAQLASMVDRWRSAG